MGSSTNTTRKIARRQIEAANGNLDVALQHLLNVREAYMLQYPQIGTTAETCMQYIVTVQGLLTKFRDSF